MLVLDDGGIWQFWMDGTLLVPPKKFFDFPAQTYTVNGIGGPDSTGTFQKGDVALFRIYGTALSSTEVIGLYSNGNIPQSIRYNYDFTTPGPVGSEVRS